MKFSILTLLLIQVANAQFQCGSGLVTLFNNNQAVSCNPQSPSSCSSVRAGYFCQMATTGNTFICCGIQSQQCGSNSPQINPNGQPQTCSIDSNCLSGYSCSSGICCPLANMGTVQIGGSCTDTIQCAGGSSCFNGQCMCPTGMTNTNGQCVRGQTGNCPSGQISYNGFCYQQSFLGGQCSVSPQCPMNAQCSNGICNCMLGFQNMNGQCTNNNSPNNCQLGQVLVNSQCMSYASPGSFCVSSLQCLEGAQCQNSQCVCPSNRVSFNGYCLTPQTSPCSQSQTNYNGQCYVYSLPGAQCQVPTQCVGSAQCINNNCQCSPGYTSMYGYCIPQSNSPITCQIGQVLINNQCYQTVPLGGSCQFTQQCQQGSCQNSICTQGGQTFCQPGQVLINGMCYNQVQLGSTCIYTQQCLQSTCQNGICSNNGGSCGVNQVLINNLCYNQVSIGGSCTYSQQCLGGSTCMNAFCQCPSGSQSQNGYCNYNNGTNGNCKSYEIFINNQCFARMPIGSPCSISQQCPNGGICQNQCQCTNGASYDGNQCSMGITQCGNGYVSYSSQCRALRSIGQSCSVNQECLSFAQCIGSICACPSGQSLDVNQVCRAQQQNSQCGTNGVLINNQCYPTVQPGGNCQYSQQCLGNSQCSNFVCQCSNGQPPVAGICNGGSNSPYSCSKSGYYVPLQNNQPINCLFNYCPDQYNSLCEYNYQVQYYICCTKSTTGKKK